LRVSDQKGREAEGGAAAERSLRRSAFLLGIRRNGSSAAVSAHDSQCRPRCRPHVARPVYLLAGPFRNRAFTDQHHRNEKLVIRLFQYVVRLREAQAIETIRFPDRHFWPGGYDKAEQGSSYRDDEAGTPAFGLQADFDQDDGHREQDAHGDDRGDQRRRQRVAPEDGQG